MAQTDVRGVTCAPTAQVWGPLVGLWVVWGSTYLAIAVMGRSVPPLLGNGLRFFGAAAVLALIVVLSRGPRALVVSRAEFRSMAIMGAALLGVGIGTLALAVRYVPSGIAALLVAVMPLFIVLFRLRAGERPAALTLVGVAIGIVGLALMVVPGGTRPVAGSDGDVVLWSLLVLGSSFCWAFFSWRSARYPLPGNPLVTSTYEMLVAGATLLGVGALTGERIHLEELSGTSLGSWAYLVLASVAGYTAFTWLIGNAPMSLVATYAYVNPVVAVFLGWAIIGEAITQDVIVGLTVVVGGVVLVVSGERRT